MYWERALLGFHLKNEWCVRSRRTGNQPAKPLGQNVCDSLRREHGSRVRLQSGEPEGRRGATSKLSPRIGRAPGTLRSEEQICCPQPPPQLLFTTLERRCCHDSHFGNLAPVNCTVTASRYALCHSVSHLLNT